MMLRNRRNRYLLLAALGALLSIVALLSLGNRGTPKWDLTLTAGSAVGKRHQIAETIAKFAQGQGVTLSLVPSSGSRSALDQVNRHQVDLALVQGGIPTSKFSHVRQVAVLHLEPLHLLVKPSVDDLSDHLSLADVTMRLASIEQPVVNVSTEGSGTNIISSELLDFFGLQEGRDYIASHMSYQELTDPGLAVQKLPDAVFTVSSVPSPVAKWLIAQRGFRPVELPVADAFRIDWSVPREARFERGSVTEATIPAFAYQINPPVPAQPLRTLGTRVQVVAHEKVPQQAIEQLNAVIYNSAFSALTDPPLSVSLLSSAAEYPLHLGAATYLRKRTPIITESVIEMTEQVLAILGAVFGVVLFVWQTLLFLRRRRRDQQFLSCIERVGDIEQQAIQYERNDQMDVNHLVALQEELNEIKKDMISRFQNGDIDGADTLSGFLMHVNDANENLTRMILHDRQPRAQADQVDARGSTTE